MVDLVLLIGRQGTGKTWVMKSIIESRKCQRGQKIGLIYWLTSGDVNVLGKYDGSMYEGTDRLSMAVMKDYDRYLALAGGKFTLLEGDRFTNFGVMNHSKKPFIIKIDNDGSKGRALRGSKQSEAALKRMKTRIGNIDADVNVKDSNEALEVIQKLIDKYYEQRDKK